MGVVLRNQLSTVLTVDEVVWQPAGQTGQDQTVSRRTAVLDAAIAAGQLAYISGQVDPGPVKVLDEVVGTGVEQSIAHGLKDPVLGQGQIPSSVGAMVTYVPDTGYGGGSGKPFEIVFGEHTSTHILVTATSGIKFKPIVTV